MKERIDGKVREKEKRKGVKDYADQRVVIVAGPIFAQQFANCTWRLWLPSSGCQALCWD